MSVTLQMIADIYKKDDPEDAGFYTLEWVQNKCASLNKSPDELLATLLESEATSESMPVITDDQPWTKNLPDHYVQKLSGAIDGLSYGLLHGQEAAKTVS